MAIVECLIMFLDAWVAVVASVALAVSIVSGIVTYIIASRQSDNQKRQNEFQERQNELQERMLALESSRERQRIHQGKRAAVRAEVVRIGHDRRLRLSNEGAAVARNIKVDLDGKLMQEHAWMLRNDDVVSILGPTAEAMNIIVLTQQSPMKAHIRITWDDESGEPGEWESELKT